MALRLQRLLYVCSMSDKYKIDDKEGIYFVTLTAVDWVDIFTRKGLKLTIINSLKYCQKNKGLIIYAWCLMHSHLHMIVGTKNGFDLSGILRDMKKFTAKEIIEKVNDEPESRREWMLHRFEYAGKFKKRIKKYKVWQDGNMAKQIITSEFMKQKLEYIHNNPVEEMVVAEAQHYLFSSAMDYVGEKGLIDVELVF
jgi:REP element-mobilizing transposase RayT